MDFNKILFIAVLGMVGIVLYDTYSKYDEQRRRDELKAQEMANQTMIQMQELQAQQLAGDQGFLGGILSNIPVIGGLF